MSANDFNPSTHIPFTQFLRPNGRKMSAWIERPMPIIEKARAILVAGGRFEIEELSTGHVSATVEHPEWEQDDRGPVASEIVMNGPDVLPMIDALVEDAYKALGLDAVPDTTARTGGKNLRPGRGV